jgi:hypothetical protein
MSESLELQYLTSQSTQQSQSQHQTKFTYSTKADKSINTNSRDPSHQHASNGIPIALYWLLDGTMVTFDFSLIGRITIWN